MSAKQRSYRCSPAAFRRALDELRRLGGTVEGGDSEGTLSAATPLGRVEGRYLFDGEELTVELTASPPLLPIQAIWGRLEAICGPPVTRT